MKGPSLISTLVPLKILQVFINKPQLKFPLWGLVLQHYWIRQNRNRETDYTIKQLHWKCAVASDNTETDDTIKASMLQMYSCNNKVMMLRVYIGQTWIIKYMVYTKWAWWCHHNLIITWIICIQISQNWIMIYRVNQKYVYLGSECIIST